jgi:hypothetical protein
VPPLHPVEQVLRSDLTREWVYQNWDRKSTGPTDVGLFAVRVALVSGTDLNSLAGSLTYFFNQHGQIEHITFRGRTGDVTKLVAFLTRTYLFEAEPAPTGELLYQVKRNGKVHSELRARPEPVLRRANPHSNIAVDLELARPGSNRFLPPRPSALQLPPAAAESTPAATTAEEATTGSASSSFTDSVQSLYDKARYATPEEQGQVLWKRWPN